jgi:hypothetical protein
MKGDIAVAGLMITAEEWQALDAASRAQLVAVITRQDPTLAAGSGPIVAVAGLAAGASLAEGTNPSIAIPPARCR